MNRFDGLLILCCIFGPAGAQTTATDSFADLLRQRVERDQVIVTNFSAQARVNARALASGLQFDPGQQRSFSLMQFSSVTVKGQQITLKGVKHYLLRSGPNQVARFPEEEPVTITVDVDPGVDQQILATMEAQLFFPDAALALKAIPAMFARTVPEPVERYQKEGQKLPKKQPAVHGCDCSELSHLCPDGSLPAGRTPPLWIKHADPQVPDGTPRNTVLTTSAAMEVKTDGVPGDIWMLHASNADAATSAFIALGQYRFSPGNCHGVPEDTTLVIDTRFQNH